MKDVWTKVAVMPRFCAQTSVFMSFCTSTDTCHVDIAFEINIITLNLKTTLF